MNRALSASAALLGDSSRAAMVVALIGGVALPAGELAMVANVSAQTASAHLLKLVDGGFVSVEQSGRHRYYRLASPEVAEAVEALSAIAPATAIEHVRRDPGGRDFVFARTCYSHLAGKLAVKIASHMEELNLLSPQTPKTYRITKSGKAWLEERGILITNKDSTNPQFAKSCLDWTERRHHLSGGFGILLLKTFLERKWLARSRSARTIRVTVEGQIKLQTFVGGSLQLN